MRLSEFDFDLPEALIAQAPLPVRSASRLLDMTGAAFVDRHINALAELLSPNDLMTFNDTRVIAARLFATKETGGRVEVLVERVTGTHTALVQMRASHALKEGQRIVLADDLGATLVRRSGDLFLLAFDGPVSEALAKHGALPLPPYITHQPDAIDRERYQTVYAKHDGAVAAPTAGLHFDDALMARLTERGIARAWVTLHVGAGTFQPVRMEDLKDHVMHEESFEVPAETVEAVERAKARGGRVLAVGTTSLRALESSVDADGALVAGSGETRLFITPGFEFRVVDLLLTNFHLPKSTLLMLVSAFAGTEKIRQGYRHAIEARYRFFSYGDAMLLRRA